VPVLPLKVLLKEIVGCVERRDCTTSEPRTRTKYTYDTDSTCGTSKGDLVKKIDAVGDTICFAYDALHRMTSTTYSGTYASVTPNRYFYYDSATVDSVAMVNVKSRMAEAYTCFSPCSTKITDIGLSYTARGEVSDVYESTPHSGGYYHSSASYWANGVLSNLNGALGYTTNYSVDGEGRVYSAGSGSELTSTSYNTASLPTAVNFASGDSDTFTYDPDTNRMTQYNFNVNGSSVVGKLTWNPVGTLASLAVTDPFDSSDAQTCSYTHDDLSRIASANCGSIWSQTFSYDVFGNINKSGSSSFGATYSSSTNRMTLIGSSTPSYDSNGNVTNDFLNSYAWDANGRPVTANGVGLTYDALGRMAEQNTSGVYTQIQYSPTGFKMYIMKSGATLVKAFVPLPAGTAEVWSANMTSPYYRHSDWLGSSRLASSSGRTVLFDGAYGPFGEPYAQSGTSDLSFTGQNEDTSSNLYDFPAREYGTQGRWPSPDPAGIASVDRRDPQSWNRYAYVRNNPLELIDPTGLYVPAGDDDDDDDDDDGGGSGGVVGGGGGGDAGIGSGSVATGGNDGGPCPGSSALCETSVGCPWPLCAPIFLPPPPPPLSDLLLPFPYIPLGGSIPMPGGCTNYVMKDCGASSDGQKPKSLCFAGNSLKDKAVRTFSLLRLAETWREWVFGAGAKITFFNVAQAGARSAGGPESLGSAAIGSAGEALGTAGTAATIAATAADVSCHVGVPLIFPNIIPTF